MRNFIKSFYLWIDSNAALPANHVHSKKIDILRCLPFIITHLACIGVFFVDFNIQCILVLLLTYSVRVFSLTGFYHRYFSHRAFKTSRVVQFIFAFLGVTAAQRGPLWWAAHHRAHHKYSDTEMDKHSPHTKGFFWSHMGWFLLEENFKTDEASIKDFAKFPELRFLNRYDSLPPIILALALYAWGGWQYVFWGYFVSTVLVYHVTFSINSIAHQIGTRTYETDDHSRNNWWLAILTFGEGWHNNHHYWPSSASQGHKFYQLDISYLIIKTLEKFNLVWDIRTVPALEERNKPQLSTV